MSSKQKTLNGKDANANQSFPTSSINSVGNIVYKNKTLYGSEVIFDYNIELVDKEDLSEADIDTRTVELLKKLDWKDDEIRQRKTGLSEIDDYLKSKTASGKKGHADIYVLVGDKVRVIVDDKSPIESVDQGIQDAIFYANCLLEKEYDIRIVFSFNGKKAILRVFDSEAKEWLPFLVDGKEINALPSREMVDLIYRYRDIHEVVITSDDESINIATTITKLKEIYRNIPHIQNDNQKSIDFTIAFIALKSILEKHGSQLGKNWEDFDVAEQKRLKEKIRTYVEDIIENLKNGYEEIFRIKEDPTGKIRAFDFLEVIKQFPSNVRKGEKGYLVQIFETLNELPHLHSSKFDLFGEVYQSLMDKHTRKIFGQFFTPRHLIRTMTRLFYENEVETLIGEMVGNKAQKPKLICDPACGTGGFLIESFKYLAANTVGVDVIDLAKKTIFGFDIYPANAVRSRINMYLAGDGFSKIDSLDSLRNLEDSRFDYILTNPPFGKGGDYCVDKNITASKRKEVNFLIKVVKLLKSRGKALIVVPDGILEAPTLSRLRKWLIQNCEIEKVIGLPKHEFAPYTHEKTYILFLKKRAQIILNLDELKTERVWMSIIDTDGYANSDKRFRTARKDEKGKWLHDELSLWRDTKGAFHPSILEENWKKKIRPPDETYMNEWDKEIEGLKYGYIEMDSVLKETYTYYPTINKSKVLRIVREARKTNPPKTVDELFEEVEDPDDPDSSKRRLEPEFEEILSPRQISYDTYEDTFYDESRPITEQMIDLIPEKYLRPTKKASMPQLPQEEAGIHRKKIHALFNVWQGHQITDEEIYNSQKGDFPIITGHNVVKGYTMKPFITDVPCVTIPSKGIVNQLYLQTQPFDANNTIALIPKDRKELDLEWFVLTQSDYITSFVTSINTNNYLNKAILENVEIEYPDYPIQTRIRDQIKAKHKSKE
jgi:type I restriction-modification system DNA methylase subunit